MWLWASFPVSQPALAGGSLVAPAGNPAAVEFASLFVAYLSIVCLIAYFVLSWVGLQPGRTR